jgi:hypothetical protein
MGKADRQPIVGREHRRSLRQTFRYLKHLGHSLRAREGIINRPEQRCQAIRSVRQCRRNGLTCDPSPTPRGVAIR